MVSVCSNHFCWPLSCSLLSDGVVFLAVFSTHFLCPSLLTSCFKQEVFYLASKCQPVLRSCGVMERACVAGMVAAGEAGALLVTNLFNNWFSIAVSETFLGASHCQFCIKRRIGFVWTILIWCSFLVNLPSHCLQFFCIIYDFFNTLFLHISY